MIGGWIPDAYDACSAAEFTSSAAPARAADLIAAASGRDLFDAGDPGGWAADELGLVPLFDLDTAGWGLSAQPDPLTWREE